MAAEARRAPSMDHTRGDGTAYVVFSPCAGEEEEEEDGSVEADPVEVDALEPTLTISSGESESKGQK